MKPRKECNKTEKARNTEKQRNGSIYDCSLLEKTMPVTWCTSKTHS